jgi:mannose-1-phosphate guanylyltransferase
MDGGGLWNAFIMIGRVTAFLDLIRSSLPNLLFSFNRVSNTMRPDDTCVPLAELYTRIPASNFSREVLVECPANLAVLPAQGLQWTDLGVPERVMRTIQPNTGRKRTMVPLACDE